MDIAAREKAIVHTDCKSVVERTGKAAGGGEIRRGHSSLASYIRDTRNWGVVDLKWVKAHPEREEGRKWSMEDWGIFMADRIAGGEELEDYQGGTLERVPFWEAYTGRNSVPCQGETAVDDVPRRHVRRAQAGGLPR